MDLDRNEWLEADGLGGFASGTASGVRTRRYHALLLAAARPPTGRFALVNGMDVAVNVGEGWVPTSTQEYGGGVRHPEGFARRESFTREPWPTWRHRAGEGLTLVQEIFVAPGEPRTFVRFSLEAEGKEAKAAAKRAELAVRPFLSGRDHHALHFENPKFRFGSEVTPGHVVWRPYEGVPAIEVRHDGEWIQEPLWYRRFAYAEESARGLGDAEDLASPGWFRLDLSKGEAALVLRALVGKEGARAAGAAKETARALLRRVATREKRRRAALGEGLAMAGDSYVVRRGKGHTIIAGYPWFTDWGRDTFLSLRGLCLATGRLKEAESILLEWTKHVSEGMLPNRFPDDGEAAEYNSVDASLWFVVVVGEWMDAMKAAGKKVAPGTRAKLAAAVRQILDGYTNGTRYGIRADADGLLAAGVPGQQLTWMDARVGTREVTPRIGKPVEVQALWVNALRVGAALGDAKRDEQRQRARQSFAEKFWNPDLGGLYDVVDVDHVPGDVDPAVRPNQILAVGGLPEALIDGKRAESVVDLVEDRLLTPLGLRSLAPDEPGYRGRYEGGVDERGAAYHQGTVWPWLLGPFVEAWIRVRGGDRDAVDEARSRFFAPIEAHLDEAGLGHVSEVTWGDPPHVPRACPFQAWSVGEALRLEKIVLAGPAERADRKKRARAATVAAARPRRR